MCSGVSPLLTRLSPGLWGWGQERAHCGLQSPLWLPRPKEGKKDDGDTQPSWHPGALDAAANPGSTGLELACLSLWCSRVTRKGSVWPCWGQGGTGWLWAPVNPPLVVRCGWFLGMEVGRRHAQPTGRTHGTCEGAWAGDGTGAAQCSESGCCDLGPLWGSSGHCGAPVGASWTRKVEDAGIGLLWVHGVHLRTECGEDRNGHPMGTLLLCPVTALPNSRFRAGGAGLQRGVPLPGTPRAAGRGELCASGSAQGPPAAGRLRL